MHSLLAIVCGGDRVFGRPPCTIKTAHAPPSNGFRPNAAVAAASDGKAGEVSLRLSLAVANGWAHRSFYEPSRRDNSLVCR